MFTHMAEINMSPPTNDEVSRHKHAFLLGDKLQKNIKSLAFIFAFKTFLEQEHTLCVSILKEDRLQHQYQVNDT